MICRIALPALLLFYCTLSEAQDVRVKTAFDTSRIYIGDQVKFSVIIEKPAGLSLIYPLFSDTLVKNIEILKGPVTDSAEISAGMIRLIQEYLVTSFDSGFYQVPPVYAELNTRSGIKRFYSDYSWLEVMRVKITPPDTASAIFDIIDPAKVPLTAGEIIPWGLLAVALALIIWLAIRIIKRFRRTGKEVVKPLITEPAHVIAFRKLENLKAEKLWQKGEVKQYYSLLTGIIREYIMNRYGVQALEMTTPEIIETLFGKNRENDESSRKLKTLLTGGDLVKFAKYQPEPSENELHFELATEYVKYTMEIISRPDNENNTEDDKEVKE